MVDSEGVKDLLVASKFLCSHCGAEGNFACSSERQEGESCIGNVFESPACCSRVSVAMAVCKSRS